MTSPASRDGRSTGRLIELMSLLWLAGVAMRMTILAMPPVIPLVHSELRMSETQVGLLIGLPLALFAVAAVPGSLLIARLGARTAAVLGMIIAALAGASRSAAIDVPTLYAAAIATGFGVAIMQPGMPTLVGEWLPDRIALGTIAYTSGMLTGALLATGLTIPVVLPLVGGSWRLDLLVWAVPALLIAPVFFIFSPKEHDHATIGSKIGALWWPNFKDPLVWILGLTFGSNNSPFFGTNAFLGDYLASQGKANLLGAALGWLNGAQTRCANHSAFAGQSPAGPLLAVFAVRSGSLGGIPRPDLRTFRCGDSLLRRIGRLHHGHYADGNARFAAASQFARRSGAHVRRHAHRQLHDGDYHPDHQRRAVGCNRKALDSVRTAVRLCGRADDTWHGGNALSAGHRRLSGRTIAACYRCRGKA